MARFFFWRHLPLTLKMLFMTVLIGTASFMAMDLFLKNEIEQSANQQLALYLSREAAANRLNFDRFLRTQRLAAEYIVSSQLFRSYITTLSLDAPLCTPADVANRQPPPWLPPNSLLRTIAPVDSIMVTKPDNQVIDCVTLTHAPPTSLLAGDFLPLLSHNQSLLAKRQEGVFLFSQKSVLNSARQTVHVIIISQINDDFLISFHNTPGDKTEVALVDPDTDQLLASSNPDLFAGATAMPDLQSNFLTTGKSFFDYGMATAPLSLVTMLPKDTFQKELAAIIRHERIEHALATIVLVCTFSLLIYWISRRVTLLTGHLLRFERQHLGTDRHANLKGDELAVLEERFQDLTNEVLEKQKSLALESEARIQLVKKNIQLEKEREQFSLLQQATEALEIGIFILDENQRLSPANPRAEQWVTTLGDSRLFFMEQYGEEKKQIELPTKGTCFFHIMRPQPLAHLKVILARDITDQERKDKELQKKRNLEAIGIMAGGIAHDFNNLMTGILGNIALARMDLPEPTDEDSPAAMLKKAEKQCLSAKEITSRFLTFSMGGSPIRALQDIRQLIEPSVAGGLSGMTTRVRFDFAPGLPPLSVDSNQMAHVFFNLAKNAGEAMDGDGTLAVTTTLERVAENSSLMLPAGDYVKIVFTDAGCGIDPDNYEQIFDPYFTTKPLGSAKAVGMGLAVAYSVVAAHGGAIQAASSPDGTTMTLYLPAAPNEPPA